MGNAELVSFTTGPIGISLGLNFAWTAVAIVLGTLMSYNPTWAPYVSDYSRYLPAGSSTSSTFTWTYWGAAIVLNRSVGGLDPDHIILSSGLGQGSGPPHPEGIRMLLYSLLDEGVPPDYLEKKTKANPAYLTSLGP